MAAYRGCRAVPARSAQWRSHGPIQWVPIRRRGTWSGGCVGRGIRHLGRRPDSSRGGGAPIPGAMELRARIRPTLRHAGLMAAAAALLVPAAGTSTAEAAKAPVVKRVSPKNVFIGETLTIHGRYFRSGIGKNTVAFKRKGAKVVLVRSG